MEVLIIKLTIQRGISRALLHTSLTHLTVLKDRLRLLLKEKELRFRETSDLPKFAWLLNRRDKNLGLLTSFPVMLMLIFKLPLLVSFLKSKFTVLNRGL